MNLKMPARLLQATRLVRAGKLIELDLADNVLDSEIEEMCRKLLANTVIENYEIELA